MEISVAFLLSTLCTFLTSTLGQDTSVGLPQFVTHPKEYSYIVRQEPVTLTCEAYDTMDITFNCLGAKMDPARQKTYESFEPETERTLVKATIDITYNEVRGYEDYWCECNAWSSAGPIEEGDTDTPQFVYSNRGFVMIPYLSKHFILEPKSQAVEEDSEVELRCSPPEGNPEPTITWKKGSHIVNSQEDSNLIVTEFGSLIIQNFQMTDEGDYTCVAKNLAGKRESKVATLTLQDYINAGDSYTMMNDEQEDELKANFITELNEHYFVTGNDLVPITCEVKQASILEFRCGGNRVDEKKIQKTEDDPKGGPKKIKIVYRVSQSEISDYQRRQQDQKAEYKCSCYAWFFINGEWKGVDSQPGVLEAAVLMEKFGNKMKDMTVAPGSTVSFHCRPPKGNPKPKTIWTLNGRQLQTGRGIQISRGMLTIQGVTGQNQGEVACVVQNIVGTREMKAMLKVSDDADMVDSSQETTDFPTTLMTTPAPGSPFFSIDLEDEYYVSQLTPAMLVCEFDGSRTLTVKCNNQRLPQNAMEVKQKFDRHTKEESIKANIEISKGRFDRLMGKGGDVMCNCVGWYQQVKGNWITTASKVAHIKEAYMRKKFMVSPVDTTVSLGRTVVFECVAPKAAPEATIMWTKDGQSVEALGRRFEIVADGSLTIFNVKRKDAGTYVCVAQNIAHERESQGARLIIQGDETTAVPEPEPETTDMTYGSTTDMMMVDTTTEVSLDSGLPIFIREPEAMYYVTGKKPAVITCRTLGAEYLTFTCNRRRVPEAFNDTYSAIDPETNRKILERSITILKDDVENALAADGYNCTCSAWYDDAAQQGWAQLDKTGQIEVAFLRKTFQQGPMSKKVTEAAAVEIPCLAPKGNPDPSIFWNKNGVRLEDMEDENVMVASTGSLVFNVFQSEDEGNYTCVAENAAGTRTSNSAEITISAPEPVDGMVNVATDGPPVFEKQLDKLNYVVRGESVFLMCSAKKTGKITFMCNGEDIEEDSVTLEKVEMEGEMYLEATLEIMSDVVDGLDVEYSCECLAWYKLSESDAEEYVNSGRGIVEMAYIEEMFSHEPEDKSSNIGEMVTFSCAGPKGFPRPEITWKKNGEMIDFISNDNLIKPGDGSLVIVQANVSDAGTYSCSASNIAGTRTSRAATLSVIEPVESTTTSLPEPEAETTMEMIEGNYTEEEHNTTMEVMPTAEFTTESMPENTTELVDIGTDGTVVTGDSTPEPVPDTDEKEINPDYCSNMLQSCNGLGQTKACSQNHIECTEEFIEQCGDIMSPPLIETVQSLLVKCRGGPGGMVPPDYEGEKTLPHPECKELQMCYGEFLSQTNIMAFDLHDSCPDLKAFLECAHDGMMACNIENKDAKATLSDISGWFEEFCQRMQRRQPIEKKCSSYKRCRPPIDYDITPEKLIDAGYWCMYITMTTECRQVAVAESNCKVEKKGKMKSDLHYLETKAMKYCPMKQPVPETTPPITVDEVAGGDKGAASKTTVSILISTIVQVFAMLIISFR